MDGRMAEMWDEDEEREVVHGDATEESQKKETGASGRSKLGMRLLSGEGADCRERGFVFVD